MALLKMLQTYKTCPVFLHLLFLVQSVASQGFPDIKVLKSTLPVSQSGTGISGARLINTKTAEGVKDVTFCIRFNYKILGGWQSTSELIVVEDWRDGPDASEFLLLNLGAHYPRTFMAFGYPKSKGIYANYLLRDVETNSYEIWSTNQYNHFCLSYKRDGTIRAVKDGKTLNVNFTDPALKDVEIPPDFLSKIYLGRCAYNYTASCSLPRGKIADFNVWDRALSEREAQDWTTCRSLEKGNLVNWDTADFDLDLMEMIELKGMQDVCLDHANKSSLLIPQPKGYEDAKLSCRRFKGEMTVVADEIKQEELVREAAKHEECSSFGHSSTRFWAGWSDEEEETVFVDANAHNLTLNDLTNFPKWEMGEPNGEIEENCALVVDGGIHRVWYDVSCRKEECFFCEVDKLPIFQLRGLCPESQFDTRFTLNRRMLQKKNANLMRGFRGTTLYREGGADSNIWVMEIPGKGDGLYATVESKDFPFGRRLWNFANDDCFGSDSVELNLNGCGLDEFGCSNGECTDIRHRCNGLIECGDKSDEQNCTLIDVDDTYIADFAPPRNRKTNQQVEVIASLKILSILGVSEVRNEISMQLQLDLTWTDGRLVMNNLKKRRRMNTLTGKALRKIWIPQVVFNNSRGSVASHRQSGDGVFFIERKGSFVRSELSELNNRLVFKGSENPITGFSVYELDLSCDFDMRTYPFDTQKCQVVLVMSRNLGRFVKLFGNTLEYLGPIDLTRFYVEDIKMENRTEENQGLRYVAAEITFRRRLFSTMMTSYLPTVLLCIVCFSTTAYKPDYFEARVTINLTALLVLTTLFISVSDSLPPTSYIKLVDVWMVANLFVPFCEVLLTTLAESYRMEDLDSKFARVRTKFDNEHKFRLVSRMAEVGMPLIYVAFIAIYFVLGMSLYLFD